MSNSKDPNSVGGCEVGVGLGMVETSWEYAQWTPIFIPNYYHDFYGHETHVYLTGGNPVGPYGGQPQDTLLYYQNLELHALAAQAQEQELRERIIAKAESRRQRVNSAESDSAYESASASTSTSPNLSPSHEKSEKGTDPWNLLGTHKCTES
jgi:hypothetical protein